MRFWKWLGLTGPDDDEIAELRDSTIQANVRAANAEQGRARAEAETRSVKWQLVAEKRRTKSLERENMAMRAFIDPRELERAITVLNDAEEAMRDLRDERGAA